MKLTIEGTTDEIKEALQAISGSKARSNSEHDEMTNVKTATGKLTTANGQ